MFNHRSKITYDSFHAVLPITRFLSTHQVVGFRLLQYPFFFCFHIFPKKYVLLLTRLRFKGHNFIIQCDLTSFIIMSRLVLNCHIIHSIFYTLVDQLIQLFHQQGHKILGEQQKTHAYAKQLPNNKQSTSSQILLEHNIIPFFIVES